MALATVIAVVLGLAVWGGSAGDRGHGARADKAGGSAGPLVLRLAASDSRYQPESRLARYFAAQVERLSQGSLRVQVTFEAAGNHYPNVEERTVRLVRDGRFELGWVGTRVWDTLDVTSFRALQAPFLVSNYALLHRIVKSPVAREMLDGLRAQHVVGLALVPGLLRHPVGFRRPLVALPDFAGARIRDQPSETSDAIVQALGATPVHLSNDSVGREISAGRLDGSELSLLNAPSGNVVTANVTLFPKTMTLFAGEHALAALDGTTRHVLEVAAVETMHHNADFPVHESLPYEGVLARRYCRTGGRIALATPTELATLLRAVRPVNAELEQDRRTRRLIMEIRHLAGMLPPPPRIVVPASCLGPRRVPHTASASPSMLDGTYHRLLTSAGASAFGSASGPKEQYPTVVTAILEDGKWIDGSSDPPSTGTYRIAEGELVLELGGNVMRFTYTRDTDGTLHLRPILPMDRGDQWVLAGAPWRRVGPPRSSLP